MGTRVAVEASNRVYETGTVSHKFDIRSTIGFALSLLMLIAAIAPACLLMMPEAAMAYDVAVASSCDLPGGSLGLDCPRTFQQNTLQAIQDTANVAVLPIAVAIEPAPGFSIARVASLAPDERSTTHLTPLRL